MIWANDVQHTIAVSSVNSINYPEARVCGMKEVLEYVVHAVKYVLRDEFEDSLLVDHPVI